ncbi:uncharacterized protein [Rutidosis leptorrhynchoides]|uniref:uncharacterized protein n=1 Tax=Rutidosis leptorrhynchoides TaxID=125765 RepID=UPI003A9A0D16
MFMKRMIVDMQLKRKFKRKNWLVSRVVVRCRKKQKIEKAEKVGQVVEPADLISELPEHIIHHILSFLRHPSDVARTSVLSKKWRSIWASFFTFEFDQKKFLKSGADPIKKFITFVDNSLTTRLGAMHTIQKFKISFIQGSIELERRVNNWITFALNKNVKELEIHVKVNNKKRYFMLPDSVFSATSLTSLRLYGCEINQFVAVNLINLKELSIKSTRVNEDVIESFVQGCPLLEDLRLVNCNGIGRLHISTPVKLRTLELHGCDGLMWVKVDQPSLLTFVHRGKVGCNRHVDLKGCENLKYLTMEDPNLTDESFQDLIKKFVNLERIVLIKCIDLKRITILSDKIKELSVIRCSFLEEANIDAPNLSLLEYSGDMMPFSSVDVAGLHEAKLNLEIGENRLEPEKLNFLKKFENDGGWNLIVSSNKNITILEDLQKIPHLSSADDMKLQLTKSPLKLKGYVDNLLRMSRPKSLSLVSSSTSEFLKYVKEKIMSREKDPKCCRYYERKCWLHSINHVTMMEEEEIEGIGTSQNHLQQKTTFKFDWQCNKLRYGWYLNTC